MYEKSRDGGLPQEELKKYLLDKSKSVTYLELPFSYASTRRIYLTKYINGKITRSLTSTVIWGPEWFQYIIHIFMVLLFLYKTGLRYDLCIAMDNLAMLPIIPLRKVSLIKKIIYYSIDYSPIRFKNKLLNRIYQIVNKLGSDNADLNWAVTSKIISEKRRQNNLSKRCLVVPVGFRKNKISLPSNKSVDKYHLVFVGILLEKQGVQLVLNCLPILIKKYPLLKLTIIGIGEYKHTLEKIVAKLKLYNKVKFTGFLPDAKLVENILVTAGIGLAPYKPALDNFSIYADPGKIKLYLGCGLPIVTTTVPTISKMIKNTKCGEVINYDSGSFISAIEQIIARHKFYRDSVLKIRERYDYDVIYQKAFRESYKIITSQIIVQPNS